MEIYIFVIFLNIFTKIISRRCGTDSLKLNPSSFLKVEKTNEDDRKLSQEFTPIKISVDYSNLQSHDNLNFYKTIFDNVSKYFSSLLSVQHVNVALNRNIINQNCQFISTANVENYLKDNDLIIFPFVDDTLDKDILAAASPCLFLESLRPLGGIVQLNKNLVSDKRDSQKFIEMLLMHELSHVLGFHPVFFEKLNLMTYKEEDGTKYAYINSPKALEKARIHFNCYKIDGIQLENQGSEGSAGSHWEARYMLGDYMISTDFPEVVISDITLALFEDTGYYKVNYYTGGLFRYGKNQGCSFLEDKCIKKGKTSFPNEFCLKSGEAFCTSSHISKGICGIVQYSKGEIDEEYQYFKGNYGGVFPSADYCPVSYTSNILQQNDYNYYYYPESCNNNYLTYANYGEKKGTNSLCFESSLLSNQNRSICYEVECEKFNKEIIIKINGYPNTVTCPGTRELLKNPNGFNGEIMCPDYNLVCSSEVFCNDMLDCINKKSTALRATYLYNNIQYLTLSKNCFFYLLILK